MDGWLLDSAAESWPGEHNTSTDEISLQEPDNSTELPLQTNALIERGNLPALEIISTANAIGGDAGDQPRPEAGSPTSAATSDAVSRVPALDVANRVLPEFTGSVLAQIGQAARPADQLAVVYLTTNEAADRQLALEQLSELTDPDGIARFMQVHLLHHASRATELSEQLRAPHITETERTQKQTELIAAIKELAMTIFDGSTTPGSLPTAVKPHSTDALNDAIAQVFSKLRTDGAGADVHTALQQASIERGSQTRLVNESLTKFSNSAATPDDRAEAIARIEQVNKNRPRRELTDLLAELRTADAVFQLKEARTADQLAAKLNLLTGLSDAGNLHAAIVNRYLTDGGQRDLGANLARGGEQAERAARTLADLVNSSAGKAAESIASVRVKEILQSWPADGRASATQLEDARKNLESLGQSEVAGDWLGLIKAQLLLKRLGEPGQSERAFQELKDAYRLGDSYAKIAMSTILLSGSADLTTKWQALDSTRDAIGNKPVGVLDLSQLSGPERNALKANALKEFESIRQQGNGLSRYEAAALGLALQASQTDTSEAGRQFNSEIRAVLASIFERGITSDQRRTNHEDAITAARETEQTLIGLFDALSLSNANDPGTRALMVEYVKAANSADNVFLAGDRSQINDIGRSFDAQVNLTIAKARNGNQSAILLLGFLAGGAGKNNSLNNPLVANETRSAMVPGNDRSKRVATALEEIAAIRPDEVICALSDRLQTTLPDSAVRLETLGKIMALTGRFTNQAREALYEGLSSPVKTARESAARGLFAFARNFSTGDLDQIVERPSAELTAELSGNVDRIPSTTGRDLTKRLVDSISASTGGDLKDRISLLASMAGSLGRFITVEDLVSLTKYAGDAGVRLLERMQGEGGSEDSAKEVQQLLGKTLLSIAESAVDEASRSRAITALASGNWGISIRDDQQFKRNLEAFAVKHSDNLAVSDAVSKLTYGAQRPSLAAQFKELGLPLSDAAIDRLTEQAITRYGAAKLQEVLTRIALFNSLSLDARLAVSASGGPIELGEKLNLRGKTLDSITFAALPENIRTEINGNRPVRAGETITVDKDVNLVAAEFNRLSSEARQRLQEGEPRFLTAGQTASISGPIDARTFNALPAEVRRQLSGSDEPLKEPEKLDLTRAHISAEDFNLLPPAVRAKITGSPNRWSGEGMLPRDLVRGKSIDAADFNRLSLPLRKKLSGKEDLLSEGERLPDLSRFSLDAAKFNRLPVDVRRAITGSSEELATGQSLDLTGKRLDAITYNALPEALRRRLNGGELAVLSGDQTLVPKPENAKIDAATFNALSPATRRLLTGTDRPVERGAISLRGVELTAELFNKLPEELRLPLTGTTERWPAGRIARDLSRMSIGAESYNALPESTRKALSSTDRPIDALRALLLLANGTLDSKDSPMKFLLQPPPLEQRVADVRRGAARESELSQGDLRLLQAEIDGKLGGFYKNANKSLGWRRIWDLAGDTVDVATLGTLDPSRTGLQVARPHAGDQWRYISQLRDRQTQVREQLGQASVVALRSDRLELADDVARYSQLAASGERLNADKLALSLYERYGDQLRTHAPAIHAELLAKGQGSLLGRMHANGMTQFAELPRVRAGSEQGTDDALALLRQLRQISPGREFADTSAWRRQALVAIDQAPSVRKLQETVQAVQEQMSVLQVEARATGTRHEDLIEDAKRRVNTIKELIGRFTADDLRSVRDLREDMRRALAATGDSRITDEKAREELDNRIKAITHMLQLVDKNEKLNLGDQLAPMERRFENIKRFLQNNHTLRGLVEQQTPKDDDIKVLDGFGPFPPSYSVSQKLTQLVQEYQSLGAQIGAAKKSGRERLEELFEAVDKPSFSADTLQKWATTDGVILAATIIVSAAAIALTFGAATPLVAAALGAAVGLGVAEGIKELQYQAGWRDEGSTIGEYSRGRQIEEIDGSRRDMHAFWDVTLPYLQEFGMATATNFMGSELGGIIGGRIFRGFADRSAAVRQAILAENRGAIRVLGESIQQLEGMALKPSLKEFGKAFVRELMSQSGFSVADQLAHGGVELVSRELGLDLDVNNAIVGTAINICLSATHRGVSLNMQMRNELAPRTVQRNAHADHAILNERQRTPEIKYQAGSPTKEAEFIRDLELSGAKVHMTDKGFAMQLNGNRIDFVREQSTSLATAADSSAADAHSPSPERLPLDWIRELEPARAKSLRNLASKLLEKGIAEMKMLDRSLGRQVTEDQPTLINTVREGNLALEAFGRDPDAVRVLSDVRAMQLLGQPALVEAVNLTREIATLKRQIAAFESTQAEGKSVDQNKFRELRGNLRTKEAELAEIKSAAKDQPGRRRLEQLIDRLAEKAGPLMDAQDTLARVMRPGEGTEYEVALANQRVQDEMKKLHQDVQFKNLKLEFAVIRDTLPPGEHFVTAPDGSRIKVRVAPGGSATMEQVDAVLARTVENGIRPNEIEFDIHHYARGSANFIGRITIRGRGKDQHHYLTTYDHESGHLYDFSLNSDSPLNKQVTDVWQECTRRAGRALYDKAREFGDAVPDGGVDALVQEMNRTMQTGPSNRLRYYACRAELMAEMFAVYMHEQRLRAAGERVPSYQEMLTDVVVPRDTDRADVMRHFEQMYDTLRSSIFSDFATQRFAKTRFMDSQNTPDHVAATAQLRKAFVDHGGGSPEFRTAFENLQQASRTHAREAVVDAIFARRHGLELNFNPENLSADLARRHALYRRLTQDNYNPSADATLSESDKRVISGAYLRYRENIGAMESLSTKRTDSSLRDITTHLNEFMTRHAPGLRQDVENRRLLGIDRVDPNGTLGQPFDTPRNHRMSTDELLADLYKVWLRRESLAAQNKPQETFENLLKNTLGENRAHELKSFPELWRKLQRDVFPAFRRMPLETGLQAAPVQRQTEARRVDSLVGGNGSVRLPEGGQPVAFGRSTENGLPVYVSRQALQIGRTNEGYYMRTHPNATSETSKTYFRIGDGPFIELTPQHGNVTIVPQMEIRLGTRTGPQLRVSTTPPQPVQR